MCESAINCGCILLLYLHFFVWAKKCQETHQHCMLDRYAFFTLKGYNVLAQKKLGKKMLCHMVASRCERYFSVLANVYI